MNDVVISEDQFLKYASNLGADIQPEDDVEILELLLERMIEEELLVQRGIELDLHKKDIGVRKEMIKQVIDFIIQVEKNRLLENLLENLGFLLQLEILHKKRKILFHLVDTVPCLESTALRSGKEGHARLPD